MYCLWQRQRSICKISQSGGILVYKNCKIYGPYRRKQDGRKHVVIIYPDGRKSSVSYPKFIAENRMGKYLKENETVDHLDTNIDNNGPENLVIKDRKNHIIEDVRRYKEQSFICPQCYTQFTLSGKELHWAISNRKKSKAGPFCGRSCAGKYGKGIQEGKIDPIDVVEIEPEYTTLKKLNKPE